MTSRDVVADAIPIRSDEMLSSEIADAILAALTAAGFPPRSDAEVAAAVLAEREACAAMLRRVDTAIAHKARHEFAGDETRLAIADTLGECLRDCAAGILSQPAPSGADALAAMLAQARREGIEAALAATSKVLARLGEASEGDSDAACESADREHGAVEVFAAIRALLPAPDAALAQDFTAWTEGGTHE